jgi:hypothetical protein
LIYPVSIVDKILQAGMKISNWQTWAWVCVTPLIHATAMALVINLSRLLVSPHFHSKYNYFFETVNKSEFNLSIEWNTRSFLSKIPIRPKSRISIERVTQLIRNVKVSAKNDADEQMPVELLTTML